MKWLGWISLAVAASGAFSGAAQDKTCSLKADFVITDQDRRFAIDREMQIERLQASGVLSDLAAVHEHLEMFGDEASLRTLYQWAKEDGFEFCDYQDFLQKHTILRRFPTRVGGLNHFLFEVIPLYAKVIGKNPTRLEMWSFLAVRAAERQQITRLALRFSPGFLTSDSGLDWDVALNAILRGLATGLREVQNRGGRMDLQLYLIATREMSGSNNENFIKTAQFFSAHRKYLAAFDIAGSELLAPISNFISALKPLIAEKAKDPDLHFTFHAGEERENASQSMKDAVLAGADRLGHGIHGTADARLSQMIRAKHVEAEVCPTSNLLVGVVDSLIAHPLSRMMEEGYRPSLSTDDPLTFSVVATAGADFSIRPLQLADEYAHVVLPSAQRGMGLDLTALRELKANGQEQFETFQPHGPGRFTLNEILLREF